MNFNEGSKNPAAKGRFWSGARDVMVATGVLGRKLLFRCSRDIVRPMSAARIYTYAESVGRPESPIKTCPAFAIVQSVLRIGVAFQPLYRNPPACYHLSQHIETRPSKRHISLRSEHSSHHALVSFYHNLCLSTLPSIPISPPSPNRQYFSP